MQLPLLPAALAALGLGTAMGIFIQSSSLIVDALEGAAGDDDSQAEAPAAPRAQPGRELPQAAPPAGSSSPLRQPSAGLWSDKNAQVLAPDPIEPTLAPGCYVRMPTGCPRQDGWHTADFQNWQKDSWPGWKENEVAPEGKKAICAEERKSNLSSWCGANDVETKFVDPMEVDSSVAPEPPLQEGCYVWAPGGCPRQPNFDSSAWRKGWTRDSWPGWQEHRVDPSQAPQTCSGERQYLLSGWCGSKLLTMWVRQAPPEPEKPGCYVFMPSGCPRRQDTFDARGYQSGWRLDAREDSAAAAASRDSCNDDRRRQINNWCGIVDTRVLLVRAAPPEPTTEGCYVWMPSGCPRQTKFDSTRYQEAWVLDTVKDWNGVHFLDTNVRAKHNCTVERRQKLQEYCGAPDVRTVYVGKAVQPPEKPGCYLMLPTGCPRQPKVDTTQWREQWVADQWHGWAEAAAKPEGERKTLCEELRKKSMNDWCGTKDVQAVMVLGLTTGAA